MKVYTVTIEVAVTAMDDHLAAKQVEETIQNIVRTRHTVDCRVVSPIKDTRIVASREVRNGQAKFFT